jgi:dipicolinate synthase subunit A
MPFRASPGAGGHAGFGPRGAVVSVLGGDDRERELILALVGAGYAVRVAGRRLSGAETAAGARTVELETALGSPWVIGPLPGVDGEGQVYARPPHPGVTVSAQSLGGIPPGATWFLGRTREPLRSSILERGVKLVDLNEVEELTVLNSIPSAEGALQMAMELSPFCLHGAAALVLGYGKTGQTLAWMLRGLGSRVNVFARRPEARARAFAAGHDVESFEALAGSLAHAEFCFNTVPAPVLTADLLANANPELTIVDLASRPGGTDFDAATARGIRARLAPGLPGIVAPRTAGLFLARVILGLLKESTHGH